MTIVDARGRRCPVPLAMVKARLEDQARTAAVTVLATDPEAPLDIGAWATDHGYRCEVVEADAWLEIRLLPA
jgi:tRNA 2-thiouridine synthesizing protein A